jgi:hypothetical protein
LPELATALRHVFIVSGVQLLAKATSFHVAPDDIKIVLVSFVLFITDMNNCCLVISAPGKTGSSIKKRPIKKAAIHGRLSDTLYELPAYPGHFPASLETSLHFRCWQLKVFPYARPCLP